MNPLKFPESLVAAWAREPDALTADPAILNADRPRRARLIRGAEQGRRALFGLLAGVLLLCAILVGRELRHLTDLAARGVVAEGRVYAASACGARGSGVDCQWFRFKSDDGREVVGSCAVPRPEAGRETVTVTFPPGHPEDYVVGWVDRAFVAGRAREWAGTALMWAALLGVPALWVEAGMRRQLALLRGGIAAAGSVTGVESRPVKNGHVFTLSYRFETPEGRAFDGGLPVTLAVRDLYAVDGADPAITVLYDPADPRRSLPYGLITLAEPA